MINVKTKAERNTENLMLRAASAITVGTLMIGLASWVQHRGTFFITADQRGQRLLDGGEPAIAAENFTNPHWRAVADYRTGNFENAAALFAGLPGPDAAFNHGNTLVMLGKYEDAVKRYDRALELRPDWEAARENRAIARGRAERLKLEGGDMTGGKMAADEIAFSDSKSKEGGDEQVEGEGMSEGEMRAVWLRQVQTTPSEFLRAKFAYQNAIRQGDNEGK